MTTKVTHPQKLPAATRQEKVLLAMHQIAEARKEAILIKKVFGVEFAKTFWEAQDKLLSRKI